MNISFNTKIPMLYDFLRVIVAKHNNIDYIKRNSTGGLKVNTRVIDAINYMWDGFDANVPGVALFFSRNTTETCFMYSVYDRQLYKINTLDALIETAFSGPVEELQLSLLKFYDQDNHSDDFYKELLLDKQKAHSHINSMKISTTCKWELTGLVNSPEDVLVPLRQFCHRVKRRLKNVYKQNLEYVKTFQKTMSVKIKNNMDYLMNSELECMFGLELINDKNNVIISFSFMNEFLLSTFLTQNTRIFMLGTEYEKSIKANKIQSHSDGKEIFLKAFSDKHRISIFRLLMDKEMYVGEIAKKLKLVLSTTSYHLDILFGARVIGSRTAGKKIYYQVNKEYVIEKFKNIAETIEKSNF